MKMLQLQGFSQARLGYLSSRLTTASRPVKPLVKSRLTRLLMQLRLSPLPSRHLMPYQPLSRVHQHGLRASLFHEWHDLVR
jgi:hypothetical protein